MMVKAAISVLAMAALQFFAAEPALKIDQHLGNMRIVSSDANARQLKLGYKKAVVIDHTYRHKGGFGRGPRDGDGHHVKTASTSPGWLSVRPTSFSLMMMADRSRH